ARGVAVDPVVCRNNYAHVAVYDQPAGPSLTKGFTRSSQHFNTARFDRRRNIVLETGKRKMNRVRLRIPGTQVEMHVIHLVHRAYEIANLEMGSTAHPHSHSPSAVIQAESELVAVLHFTAPVSSNANMDVADDPHSHSLADLVESPCGKRTGNLFV